MILLTWDCPLCEVEPGQEHLGSCKLARCLVTGRPRRKCPEDHDHGHQEWTGWLPGEAEAIEYGVWGRITPDGGWVTCDRDDPVALPDRKRLIFLAEWDAVSQRWVIRS